jgi:hypothetical protein
MTEEPPDCWDNDDPEVWRYIRAPDEELSTTITLGVTDVLNCEIEALPPLGAVLDVDALDSLFVSNDANLCVTFEYSGCLVTVERGNEILVSRSSTTDK